jgi:protease-3
LSDIRIQPSEQEVAQAVDRLVRGIQNAKRAFPVRQLSPAVRSLTRNDRWDEAQMLAAADAVTPEALVQFVDGVLKRNNLRAYMFGSYSRENAESLASMVKAALPDREAIPYQRTAVYEAEQGKTLVLNRELPVDDLGMMYLFAAPESSIQSEALAGVLQAHLADRAFNTLRTEEQLGYAAGGFTTSLQDQTMVGFYIQTPVKNPVDMLARFDAFKAEYRDMLAALTEEEFAKIKAGVLTSLTQPPKNLAEEAGPFLSDWNQERYDYDTRAKLIAATESLTLEAVQAFYEVTVMTESPARILVQLRGQAFADSPFATIEGAEVIDSVADFHTSMPTQSR